MLEVLYVEVLQRNHDGDWGTKFGMLIEYLFEKFPNLELRRLSKQLFEICRHSTRPQKRDSRYSEYKQRTQQAVVLSKGEKSGTVRLGHKSAKLVKLSSTGSTNVMEFNWIKGERGFIIHITLGF